MSITNGFSATNGEHQQLNINHTKRVETARQAVSTALLGGHAVLLQSAALAAMAWECHVRVGGLNRGDLGERDQLGLTSCLRSCKGKWEWKMP